MHGLLNKRYSYAVGAGLVPVVFNIPRGMLNNIMEGPGYNANSIRMGVYCLAN